MGAGARGNREIATSFRAQIGGERKSTSNGKLKRFFVRGFPRRCYELYPTVGKMLMRFSALARHAVVIRTILKRRDLHKTFKVRREGAS